MRLSLLKCAVAAAALVLSFVIAPTLDGATFTVTTATDGGVGSLRQAITDANALAGPHTIDFNIAGAGPHTITVTAALPAIMQPLTINGYTQPGSSVNTLSTGTNAVLMIRLDGGTSVDFGLNVAAANVTVRGLNITRFRSGGFAAAGILLQGGSATITGNFIGTDPTGTSSLGNDAGVLVASANNVIGGNAPADRNLLSGNQSGGQPAAVVINTTSGATVQGNLIGTNAAGSAAVPNGYGLIIRTGSNLVQDNVISGNSSAGLFIAHSSYWVGCGTTISGNQVRGNLIGTNAGGSGGLSNGTGIEFYGGDCSGNAITSNVIGGTTTSARNVISGNGNAGVSVGNGESNVNGNSIKGNYIGLNSAGTSAIGNTNGIELRSAGNSVGGTTTGAGNVISGNGNDGVVAYSSSTVQGNYVGLNAAGTAAITNGRYGVFFDGATGGTLGGTTAAARNVVSGSTNVAVIAGNASNITIQGNYIGTNAAGTAAIPNASYGVYAGSSTNITIGGTASGAGNVISGNNSLAVVAVGSTSNVVVQGNLIGTAADGTTPLGNASNAVHFGPCTNCTVGGTVAGAANVIANNGGTGIYIGSGTGNSLIANAIYANGGSGIVLDDGVAGVPTPNDPGDGDSGPNNLQNFPVLTSAITNGSTINITGSLDSAPGTYTIHFYANSGCDASGYGEGRTYLGSTTTSNGTINVTLSASVPTGAVITSTATDGSNNTSEFSQCLAADSAGTLSFSAATYSAVEAGPHVTVTVNRSGGSAGTVGATWTTADVEAVSGTDYTGGSSTVSLGPGATSTTFNIPIASDALDEIDETFTITLSSPTGGASIGSPSATTVTITDDDAPPTVQFTNASQASAGESGTLTITAQLSAASGQTVTVPFTVSGASTASGTDYGMTSSPLVFSPGSTSESITITITSDSIDESDETVIVNLGTPANATLATTNTHTATITDDDTATVSFTSASQSSAAESGTLTITAQLSTASASTVSVPFSVNAASSAGGSDYSVSASPLTFAPGSTSEAITITITSDTIDESNETVIVDMGTPTNATASGITTHTATITDDDAATVGFASASQASANESGTMTITALLSTTSDQNVTVPFSVNGASTATGSDYAISSSPLVIPAGSTTAAITITITADTVDEPSETVIVDIGTPTNATATGITQHTATITDDDGVDVSFTSASQASASESGTMTITVQLSTTSASNVIVPFSVNGASTASGSDYTITPSPLVIPAGSTTGTITVNITTDPIDEPNETVIVDMGTPTNALASPPTTHTATITDDDTATVSFTAASQASANESGTMNITAQLSTTSASNVSVPFSVNGASTASGSDYTITASPLVIPAGSTTGTITITITPDSVDEPNETVIVDMGTPTNALASPPTTHTATITDDDTATVSFTAASQASANESGTMTITAQLSTTSASNVTVPFTVNTASTASASDYTLTASPLVIPAGSTTGTITIAITPDSVDEADETVIVDMGTPTNASAGSITQHTATITDDDSVTVSFTTASQSSTNESGTMTITAQLSTTSASNVTVPFAVNSASTASGSDYTIAPSPLVIPAGAPTGTITITITGDTTDEPNETIVVSMGTPVNAATGTITTHTATITDDDDGGPPTPVAVTFATTSQVTAGESGTAAVIVDLSGPSASDVTVPFTVATGSTATPGDYALSTSPLVIPAGATSGAITINITVDTTDEDDEQVVVTMGTPAGATAGAITTHTLTITDDDPRPALSVHDLTVTEGSGVTTVVRITVTLSNPSDTRIIATYALADGTATAPADYSRTEPAGTATIEFAAGETSQTVSVLIQGDELNEPDEYFEILVDTATAYATVGDGIARVTIANDDPTGSRPSVRISDTTVIEGDSFAASSRVRVTLSSAATERVAVSYQAVAGTATLGEDFSEQNGVIEFLPGQTAKEIEVYALGDRAIEPDESYSVVLFRPTGLSVGDGTAVVTIIDDDDLPELTIADATATEDGREIKFDIILSHAAEPGKPVSVRLRTVPRTATSNPAGFESWPDYYPLAGQEVTFSGGQTMKSIRVPLVDDHRREPDERFTLDASTSNTRETSSSATGTIIDDDGCPSPALSAVPHALSGEVYLISLSGNYSQSYYIEESADEGFTAPQPLQFLDWPFQLFNAPFVRLEKTVSKETHYYYRLASAEGCGGIPITSPVISVRIVPLRSVEFPPPPNTSDEVIAPYGTSSLLRTQVSIAGTGEESTYDATADEPWLSVSPAAGPLPPAGATMDVTIDPRDLSVGTSTGTIRVRVNTPNARGPAFHGTTTVSIPVSVSLVTPITPSTRTFPAPAGTALIPAVAHAQGVSSQWRSDVRLFNPGPGDSYLLTYTPAGDDASATVKHTTIPVDSNQTIAIDDIVRVSFGTTGTGTLEIRPLSENGRVVATSRTFNTVVAGTLGQFVPAIPLSRFISAGSRLALPQLSQANGYRTNIGVAEAGGSPVAATIRLFDPQGAALASVPVHLKAGEQVQLNSILASRGIEAADARAEVTVTGGGKITAYASVVDGKSGDAQLVSGIRENASSRNLVIPGVANFPSAKGQWRTDARVINTGASPTTAILTYFSGASSKSVDVSIAAGETLVLDDLVATTFGMPGTGGAIHVNSTSQLVASARTYDQQPGGSFGQFIPAVASSDGVAFGDVPLQLLQVEESVRYRTNLGLAEISGAPARIEVTAALPDRKTTAITSIELAANQFMQIGAVLRSMGIDTAYNTRIAVRVVGGSGRVAAYASSVDNKTGDATYIPAQ